MFDGTKTTEFDTKARRQTETHEGPVAPREARVSMHSPAVGRRRGRSAGRLASTASVRLRSPSCLRVEPVAFVGFRDFSVQCELVRALKCSRAALTKVLKSGANSPVRQKFSGCHCTPTQNSASGFSMASTTPSGAMAEETRPWPTRATDWWCRLLTRQVWARSTDAPSACSRREPGVTCYGVCLGALRFHDAVRKCRVDGRGNVLDESATGRDIQYLRAAADREEGQVGAHCATGEIDFELIAPRFRILDRRMPLVAVEDRVDVSAAGQQEAIDLVEYLARALADLEDACAPARLLDRGDVVIQPAASRDANGGFHKGLAAPCLHLLRHVRPHELERLGELRPVVGDRRRPPGACVHALFIDDRIAVIERVERLRQAEGVLRDY